MTVGGWDTGTLRAGETISFPGNFLVNPDPSLRVGDTFTIEGLYQRRTFWQWLTRQPRELQVWRVTETA